MAVAAALPVFTGCTSPSRTVAAQQSLTDKMSASIKASTDKVAGVFTPEKKKAYGTPDEGPNGKPGPMVFVAAAQMMERAGNLAEAETNYRRALDLDPNNVDALVGYARLEDHQGNFEAATKFYQRAIKKHPKNAAVHNDLGLCYHRRGMLPEATQSLKRAVDLNREEKLYRNNLAAAYVAQSKNKEALEQLIAAHGRSVGHYNLGHLLAQKDDQQGALAQFQAALEADPKLTSAHQWIAHLAAPSSTFAAQAGGMQTPMAQQSPANASYVAQSPGIRHGQAAQYAPPANAPAYAPPGAAQTGAFPPMPR